MISVIMPLYNEEKYLGYAIESVKRQLYKDWELIIVNDASTDSSLSIAKSYADEDSRINVINLEKNMGCCNALNVGIDAARGDYICWLSSDDEYFENMMSDCMEDFQDGVDAVVGRHRFYYQNTGMEEEFYFDKSFFEPDINKRNKPYITLFFAGNAFNACSVLMRREAVLRAGKFSLKHNYAGDYDFMMRLCAYSNVIFIDKELTKSRVHDEQVTAERKNEMDVVQIVSEMLHDDRERRCLLEKAHLVDCRKMIFLAIENRIKLCTEFGMDKEKKAYEKVLDECVETIPVLKRADEYCKEIKDELDRQDYETASKKIIGMPPALRNFVDEELIGIFWAYIFLGRGDEVNEKKALDAVYESNPLNYECNYLLAGYYASKGEQIDAMEHFVKALRNSSKEDYDFIFSQFKDYINIIGETTI